MSPPTHRRCRKSPKFCSDFETQLAALHVVISNSPKSCPNFAPHQAVSQKSLQNLGGFDVERSEPCRKNHCRTWVTLIWSLKVGAELRCLSNDDVEPQSHCRTWATCEISCPVSPALAPIRVLLLLLLRLLLMPVLMLVLLLLLWRQRWALDFLYVRRLVR